jgi:16S rRNA processing protein RimM
LTNDQWKRLFKEEAADYNFLKQFLVLDQNNQEIGHVTDVLDIPSNTLLQVNYKDHIVEIPINEETLLSIDEDKEVLKITIPEGLLDL